MPGDEERQARLEKMAGLRRLRSYGSWLSLDPHAQFHDMIDCAALLDVSDVTGVRSDAGRLV
ncbi:hypothetical protein EN828_07270 [Mesorhizobium sp. M2D.F.Ca.ET.185.01.1.1]|uniref:hypothetical protein n=1 Tax=unclassified Mesorhizobium TaxID=325217 RepID=UPI000FCA16A5|nr:MULTISPECIES: hypothetical protein [unclassified Mesorhizobium]NUS20723.1 hypothetical protein [Mesorhizobium sp.]TGP55701.1 hypothetical protein EN873_07505 [bacterium M00.F.Ca.ET.230.01.1.1]TGP70819.1 hypothetical protein EN868_03865 [Mesorhizobium sp. M2D.F.Ca.ET.225.01.1.1]TGP82883.1 hypothetical protein EN870_03815 [bacterium M00.F.Ca.ET.227.01.1.1]TGP94146.1 hypothetical protein EN864_11785 [bacterium M00.F.Ca.ET.221.01.1.1]TGP97600.1 hypothetical protein EN865_08010 [bacterium M00.F